MRGFLRETIVELVMSKAIWLYVGVTVISCLMTLLAGSGGIRVGSSETETVGKELTIFAMNGYVGFLTFLMVVGSSGVFPRMLRKGTIDFYLARPMSRTMLLFTKFQSLLFVYSILLIISSMFFWLCLSVSVHSFDPEALLLIGVHLFFLLLWMSVAILAALVGQSQGIAIMTVIMIWVGQSILFQTHTAIQGAGSMLELPGWLRYFVEICYQALPKATEITEAFQRIVAGAESTFPLVALGTTVLFLISVLYFARLVFVRKNF
jgi:ABC-type transport system involved in multi-copper enzyme maturation permease subunit